MRTGSSPGGRTAGKRGIAAACLAGVYLIACVWALLWAFVWLEAGFLPHRLSVSGPHHGFWFYPAIIVASVLAGGMILTALTLLLGLLYDGDRAKAVFRTMGFPWYLITFFLTIFLPGSHAKHARDSADLARGA